MRTALAALVVATTFFVGTIGLGHREGRPLPDPIEAATPGVRSRELPPRSLRGVTRFVEVAPIVQEEALDTFDDPEEEVSPSEPEESKPSVRPDASPSPPKARPSPTPSGTEESPTPTPSPSPSPSP